MQLQKAGTTTKGSVENSRPVFAPLVKEAIISRLIISSFIPEPFRASTQNKFKKAIDEGWATDIGLSDDSYSIIFSSPTNVDGDWMPYDGGEVTIRCFPEYQETSKYFSVEFDPSNVDMNHLKSSVEKMYPIDFKGFINHGIINFANLMVNISNISISDVIAGCSEMDYEELQIVDGCIQSKHLSSTDSHNEIHLFSELSESSESQSDESDISSTDRVKIVLKLQPNGCSVKKFKKLPNPFANLTLTLYSEFEKPKEIDYDPYWTMFLRCCSFEGVSNAIKHLNDVDKEAFLNRLAVDGKTDWWNPEKAWNNIILKMNDLIKSDGAAKTNKKGGN